jgi:hypothetical protein
MLTKFAAALLATSLIAGSALAAQPSGAPATNGAAPAVQSQTPSTPAAKATTATKSVKHTARHRNHVRKHVARSKGHVVHHARHAKPAKTHQARMSKSATRS